MFQRGQNHPSPAEIGHLVHCVPILVVLADAFLGEAGNSFWPGLDQSFGDGSGTAVFQHPFQGVGIKLVGRILFLVSLDLAFVLLGADGRGAHR